MLETFPYCSLTFLSVKRVDTIAKWPSNGSTINVFNNIHNVLPVVTEIIQMS